jgi:hypothetical protein
MGQAVAIPQGFKIVGQPSNNISASQAVALPEGFRIVEQGQSTKPTSMAGEIARPFLRAGKSIAVGTLGSAGDLAQEAVNFPEYIGNVAARGIEKAVYGDNYIQPYDTSKVNTASKTVANAFNSATGGLTENRNQTERVLEIPQEIVGGIVGPAAVGKVARATGDLVSEGGKKLLQKITDVKPELVQAFNDAGVAPRLADVTNSKPTKAFQNLLEVFPGSASTIQKATQNQVDDITKQLAGITKNEGGTIAQTGTKIKSGSKSFINSISERAEKNFERLGEKVGKDTPINLDNTLKLLKAQGIEDVAAIGDGSTARVIDRINKISEAPTYNQIRILRSSVGKKSYSSNLGEDDRGAIKQIYGALTEDMRNLAQSKGKEAINSFNKANNFYSTTSRYIDKNIQPLIKAKTPEKVYQLAFSGSEQGGTNLNRVLRVLKPEQKEFVRGSVVKEMGTQKAGLQNAEGDIFSPNKFLTEYNKLQKVGTDKYIFTPSQRESLGTLNKAISSIKETSKLAQTSNNLPYLNWLGLLGGVAATPVSIGQAGLAVGSAKISAELMTSPKFINWLAKAPRVRPAEIPKHLKSLSIIASQNPTLREDILDYIDSITVDKNQQQ